MWSYLVCISCDLIWCAHHGIISYVQIASYLVCNVWSYLVHTLWSSLYLQCCTPCDHILCAHHVITSCVHHVIIYLVCIPCEHTLRVHHVSTSLNWHCLAQKQHAWHGLGVAVRLAALVLRSVSLAFIWLAKTGKRRLLIRRNLLENWVLLLLLLLLQLPMLLLPPSLLLPSCCCCHCCCWCQYLPQKLVSKEEMVVVGIGASSLWWNEISYRSAGQN